MAKSKNNEVSGWVGWVGFASLMLFVVGILHIISGFVALFKDDVFLANQNLIITLDYSQWGWIHIIGGLIAIYASGSLAQGKIFGRTIAVLIALGSLFTNFVFLPAYPIWSIIMITVSILVLWAVTVHGSEVKNLE